MSALGRLADVVAAEGGLLAQTLTQPASPSGTGTQPTSSAGTGTQPTAPAGTGTGPVPAPGADGDGHLGALAAGSRSDGDEYALLVEAIHEGSLLHYGDGRVLNPSDPDLALLGGDRLYAIGLDRLARLGDVDAVAELADVISRVAQAHAEGDPARAEAAWEAGARAVGSGSGADRGAARRSAA